jgi:hypothetical protein
MDKLDLAKQFPSYYKATTKPELITLPRANYLAISGQGAPESAEYGQKLQALYSVVYGLKFLAKAQQQDFVVAKLEGLWWFDADKYSAVAIVDTPTAIPRSDWYWRMLIQIPESIPADLVETAKAAKRAKKQIPFVDEVAFLQYEEGLVVQMLHLGPFSNEHVTLQQIIDFCQANKLDKAGLHHEIYLSDFRRTKPEALKTILRESVKPRL